MKEKRIIKLIFEGVEFTTPNYIYQKLSESEHNWILDCEIDNVILEIKNNILIFKSGIFYWGYWKWGIFENGDFRSGIWKGGIFKDGTFNGQYNKMVKIGGTIKGEQI